MRRVFTFAQFRNVGPMGMGQQRAQRELRRKEARDWVRLVACLWLALQAVCVIRLKSWAMILKHRFIGSQAVQWLNSECHPPGAKVDDPQPGVHQPACASVVGSPPATVECQLEFQGDLDDQVRCREGAVSTGLAPSQQQVGAERSRSPRRGPGSTSELTGHSSVECSVDELGAEVLRMFDSLPSDDLKRGQSNVRATSKSYATGAYVLGGAVGLKAHATEHPEVLKACAGFVHARAPGFKFSSFNIFEDVQTDRHKDHWNANLANLAIPLTPFKEGSIFVEHQGGLDLSAVNGEPGTRLRVALGAVKFNARHCWHHTEEWQSRRVILVAFTIRHVEKLSSEHRQFLLDCGVPLPECAPEESVIPPAEECFAASRQAMPVPPLPSHRSGLVPEVPSSPHPRYSWKSSVAAATCPRVCAVKASRCWHWTMSGLRDAFMSTLCRWTLLQPRDLLI